ncbi:hypothetical protein EV702DRAFT_1283677 [Suillus placidus]|uniref:Uncharacterized protein n=1 Tax=Suillus placidus TaxID=48579 RepID=A0A9P6ZH75_9AGAM|nr:hypothetical protein EV702DRAFT_1283677 [Suillus placidus]
MVVDHTSHNNRQWDVDALMSSNGVSYGRRGGSAASAGYAGTIAHKQFCPQHYLQYISMDRKIEDDTNTPISAAAATISQCTPSNANKCPNIERPTQPQPPTNTWHYLRSGDNTTAEISVNGVRTLNNGYKITATPVGSFPTPQLGQSTWRNVSQILKEKWPQKEGAKAQLKDAITKIIGDSDAESLVISTPTAAVELIEHFPPPWHYLISGIPPEAIERLLHLQVCSSADICIFVPFEQPLPTYAFTLENFSFPDSDSTNQEIAAIVKNTIRSNPDVMQFIHDNIPTPDAEAALCTLNSIRVSSLILALSKSVKETVWNVYFDPTRIHIETVLRLD